MFIPKVKFSIIPLELEISLIYHFLFYKRKWKWDNEIIKEYPSLKDVFVIKNKKNREIYLKNYIVKLRNKEKGEFKKSVKKYSKDWKRVEKRFLINLSEILNTSWPKNKRVIKAMISINPICPRFIDNWSFSLTYKRSLGEMREIIMHEICHFLYFKKWKEVFPNAKAKTFEYPYIEWRLSEILAPIILNSSKIQKFLKRKVVFYKEYWNLSINGVKVPKYFSLLYKKYENKQYDFDNFLKKAYQIIKKNKNIFKKLY